MTVPATLTVPPLDIVKSCAMPPDNTLTVPPLDTAKFMRNAARRHIDNAAARCRELQRNAARHIDIAAAQDQGKSERTACQTRPLRRRIILVPLTPAMPLVTPPDNTVSSRPLLPDVAGDGPGHVQRAAARNVYIVSRTTSG